MNQFRRILTFFKALLWHIYAGFPKSSQNLINHRYNLCSICENFDTNNQQCLLCGCNISKQKKFLNKLAWADQKCPIEKW